MNLTRIKQSLRIGGVVILAFLMFGAFAKATIQSTSQPDEVQEKTEVNTTLRTPELTTKSTTVVATESSTQSTTKRTTTTTKSATTPARTTKRATTQEFDNENGLPSNFGSFKSYTDYHCLSRSSAQWKLQEKAYTDENGLRKIGDAYLVALGSYYGKTLGTKYKVTLSSGKTITVMLCDFKSDRHTDGSHRYTAHNGCALEFYVDTDKLPSSARRAGSIGAINGFGGTITNIEKVA